MKEDNSAGAFVDYANPHSWFLVASELHDEAVNMRKRWGQSVVTRTDRRSRVIERWDGINRSTFLLCGFALENALKAFLVYEHPNWVSNGTLSRSLRSHSLVQLRAKSNLAPYKGRLGWVLERFEDGLDSWARYPCGLSISDTRPQKMMNILDWDGYQRLIKAYAHAFSKLCARQPWLGPHGFYGKWMIRGEFMGARIGRPLNQSARLLS